MGLDMFLAKKPKSSDKDDIYISDNELAYWRKANAIHSWFISNCAGGLDNCEPVSITKDELLELRARCFECLDNPDRANEILPVKSGFFFGSENYDEWYFRDISGTITLIDNAIESVDFNTEDIFYLASW